MNSSTGTLIVVGNRELQFILITWVMLLLLRLTKSLGKVHNFMNTIFTKDISGYDSCAGYHTKFNGEYNNNLILQDHQLLLYFVYINILYGLQPHPY